MYVSLKKTRKEKEYSSSRNKFNYDDSAKSNQATMEEGGRASKRRAYQIQIEITIKKYINSSGSRFVS
jgi:hypothetical protein